MGLNMLRMTKAERGKEVIIICQRFLDDYTITLSLLYVKDSIIIICQRFLDDYTITNTITITHSNIKRFLDVRPKEEKSSAKIRTWVLRIQSERANRCATHHPHIFT